MIVVKVVDKYLVMIKPLLWIGLNLKAAIILWRIEECY